MNWISLDVVLAVHGLQLAEHGGAEGVRDLALLESAIGRPRNILAYEEGDCGVARLAAAYCHGIIKNHPFVDGNKRTGFVVLELFLAKNGFELAADDFSCLQTIEALAAGALDEAALTAWIVENLQLNPTNGPSL